MNLDAVVIILREVLEASMLSSLLLALAQRRQLGHRWFFVALLVGLALALVYANQLGPISEWWDYSGQEIINASLQFGICLGFALLIVMLYQPTIRGLAPVSVMAAIVVMALIRELSEISLYLQLFAQTGTQKSDVWAGGIIGFVTGISVGITLYFLSLWAVDWSRAQPTILLLLSVVVAGLGLQAVSLLIQVDRLPALQPLWDSSALLSEGSLFGQLLYALIGYEATPTLWHLIVYFSVLLSLLSLLSWGLARERKRRASL